MRWSELIIEGSKAACTGFVAGFLAARDQPSEDVVWEHEVGLTVDSLAGRIAAVFSAERHHGLFAPETLAKEIAAAVKMRGIDADLALKQHLIITAVVFEFEAEVFSEKVALELRACLGDLPAGTRLEDLTSGQEVHPEASGIELYSPQHDYVYRVSGRVRGDGGALRLLRRLCAYDVVQAHDVEIGTTTP